MTQYNQSCGGTLGLAGGVNKQTRKPVGGVLGLFGGLHYGTAQAGASKSITLAAAASELPDAYAGCVVEITGGAGVEQKRNVVRSRKNWLYNSFHDTSTANWNGSNSSVLSLDSIGTLPEGVAACIKNTLTTVNGVTTALKGGGMRYFRCQLSSRLKCGATSHLQCRLTVGICWPGVTTPDG